MVLAAFGRLTELQAADKGIAVKLTEDGKKARWWKETLHMSKKTVAELLAETLALAGVERIYGVAGDSLNGITDSIR